MNKIERTPEGPNIAGVSLALYLLVSILSMMAAYEVGKASDDVRNSVVVTLQSSPHGPNKSGDDVRDHFFIAPAIELIALDHHPRVERRASVTFLYADSRRVFDARAPPGFVSPRV